MMEILNTQQEKILLGELQTYSYKDYSELMRTLAAAGSTTGVQTEGHIYYTKLNAQRMERVNKTWTVIPEVSAFAKEFAADFHWMIISESWCGDAATNVAAMALMADALKIQMEIILRDENPEIMDRFLTHGTRSIPKLIVIDNNTHMPIATWGPRQQPAAALVHEARHNNVHADIWKADLQKWYNQDKGVTLQKEILEILKLISERQHVQLSQN